MPTLLSPPARSCSDALPLGEHCRGQRLAQMAHKAQPLFTENFNMLMGAAAGLTLVLMIVTKVGRVACYHCSV